MKFRHDINGLRAIAVIAVLVFHFNRSLLPGGFAGVDVFFVISGFLMTAIIFRGLEADDFSLRKFYIARANRIIPAIAALCVVLLGFGWFRMIPSDFQTLSAHAASTITFISNIVYWREVGYFDSTASEKWLLHTWSLSVEWQFYVLYPIALLLARKFLSLDGLKKLVLAGTFIGFFVSVIGTHISPDAAYFLFPTRAWELLAGGVAFLYRFDLISKNAKVAEWLGLILIAVSYVFIDSADLWPGYLAAIPIFGTFLVIQAHRSTSIVTNNYVFQKIGSWSYSIYLWHWPILVFLLYHDLSGAWMIAGIAASIGAGFLSYHFIERRNFRVAATWLDIVLRFRPLQAAVAIGVLGAIVFINNGFAFRGDIPSAVGDTQKPSHYQYCFDRLDADTDNLCVFHDDGRIDREVDAEVAAIIVGDSHGTSIVSSVLDSFGRSGLQGDVLFYGTPGCLPVNHRIRTIYETAFTRDCNRRNKSILSLIKSHPDAEIIFSARYSLYFWGEKKYGGSDFSNVQFMSERKDKFENAELLKASLYSLLVDIRDVANLHVVYPVPEQGKHVPNTVARAYFVNGGPFEGVSRSAFDQRNAYVIEMLDKLPGVTKIDPAVELCDTARCRIMDDAGGLLYYDDDHLSVRGAEFISGLFDVIWQTN